MIGRTYFFRLRTGKVYTGKVLSIDFDKNGQFYWVKILDKFQNKVLFVSSEIIEAKDETIIHREVFKE